MIPLAQKPAVNFGQAKRPSGVARRLGQDRQPLGIGWTPVLNVQTIGGLLLASGAIANMFVSTDKRTGQQICRALAAAFGVYLVADGTWHPSQSYSDTVISTFVLPPLGLSVLIAGLAWVGVMAFGKKK